MIVFTEPTKLGVDATHWKITRVNANVTNGESEIFFGGYPSEAAANDPTLQPMAQKVVMTSLTELDGTAAQALLSSIYTLTATLPAFTVADE